MGKNTDIQVAQIIRPFTYVFCQKGKNIRTQFVQALNHWYKLNPDLLERLGVMGEKLHNASLLIDDIEDNSELRRGEPTAHLVFGKALSINAANYMYFDVLQDILDLNITGTVEIFTEQMISLHHGQGMDLYWRDLHKFKEIHNDTKSNNTKVILDETDYFALIPSEKDYQDVIVRKTSGQFVFGAKIFNLFSKEDKDSVRLAELIGLCFQIRDDLMNLVSSEYKDSKGFCEDISEGKLSFPVIHALNKNSFCEEKRRRLLQILRMKTTDLEMKDEALEILEESGALKYTAQLLVKLKSEITKEIKILGGNPELDALLKTFWG